MKDLRKNTQEITQYLEAAGYRVRVMWECQWHCLNKSKEVTVFIKTLKTVQSRKQLSFQKILAGIKDGSLFGFVLCYIHTPETLKKLFEELTPIFKNVKVSREDIGDHM